MSGLNEIWLLVGIGPNRSSALISLFIIVLAYGIQTFQELGRKHGL